jgi:RNA polymerase sigma factor (sigma-70 family)
MQSRARKFHEFQRPVSGFALAGVKFLDTRAKAKENSMIGKANRGAFVIAIQLLWAIIGLGGGITPGVRGVDLMEPSEVERSTAVLVRLLAEPDSDRAFREFTDRYLARMKASCRKLGMQDADADDVCAAILLRFYEKREFRKFAFESKQRFNGWLNTVVRNAVFTFVRDRGRRPEAWSVGDTGAQQSLEDVAETVADSLLPYCEEDLARGEIARSIVRDRVDAKTMRAFELLCYEGRKGADVAAELGMKLPSVWKARSRVAKMLQEEFRKLTDLDQ